MLHSVTGRWPHRNFCFAYRRMYSTAIGTVTIKSETGKEEPVGRPCLFLGTILASMCLLPGLLYELGYQKNPEIMRLSDHIANMKFKHTINKKPA